MLVSRGESAVMLQGAVAKSSTLAILNTTELPFGGTTGETYVEKFRNFNSTKANSFMSFDVYYIGVTFKAAVINLNPIQYTFS